MNASFCASIAACTVFLASGGSLQAQYEAAGAPFVPHGYEVGHSQPAYPATGAYLPPEYSAEELLWFRGEYLLWWFKDADIPPLVTTGSPSDPVPGALGQPNTRVLFGDEIDYDSFNGARFTIGGWFDAHRTFGAEVNWFLFDRGTKEVSFASPGDALLTRPFFDVSSGISNSILIGGSTRFVSVRGQIDVTSSSRLLGFEINGLCDPWYERSSPGEELDLLYGFRYLDLEEDLLIDDVFTMLAPVGSVPAGFTLDSFDSFDTRNRFYGGQAGFRWQARRGRASVRFSGKLALGATHQNVAIAGAGLGRRPGGAPELSTGGELTQRSNIGEYSRDRFSVVPELGAYLGYEVLEGLSVYAGYTFVYWTNVVRPGDQIDLGLNRAQGTGPTISGEPRPAFDFHETDFWAHGLSLGASLTF